mmetsp:Transcript_17223/g.59826  ORF Transcript_17223/g.59826 Transcript_17223/m.59826 type:complete len:267 (+) Transcript_17223:285-1085(+)
MTATTATTTATMTSGAPASRRTCTSRAFGARSPRRATAAAARLRSGRGREPATRRRTRRTMERTRRTRRFSWRCSGSRTRCGGLRRRSWRWRTRSVRARATGSTWRLRCNAAWRASRSALPRKATRRASTGACRCCARRRCGTRRWRITSATTARDAATFARATPRRPSPCGRSPQTLRLHCSSANRATRGRSSSSPGPSPDRRGAYSGRCSRAFRRRPRGGAPRCGSSSTSQRRTPPTSGRCAPRAACPRASPWSSSSRRRSLRA